MSCLPQYILCHIHKLTDYILCNDTTLNFSGPIIIERLGETSNVHMGALIKWQVNY